MKNKHYSIEQINQLSKDPRIKHIDEYSVRFTFECRLSIYERIKDNICTTSVRHALLVQILFFCHNVGCKRKLRKTKYGKNKKLHEVSIKSTVHMMNIYYGQVNLKMAAEESDLLNSTNRKSFFYLCAYCMMR